MYCCALSKNGQNNAVTSARNPTVVDCDSSSLTALAPNWSAVQQLATWLPPVIWVVSKMCILIRPRRTLQDPEAGGNLVEFKVSCVLC